MTDTTTDSLSPTFSDNWGHFYTMVPLIAFGTLVVGHWKAAPVFIVAELMYFLFHTRTEHPNHPIQKDDGTLATFFVIAVCLWLILPPMGTQVNLGDVLLGNSITGAVNRISTFFTAYSLHLLSEFVHDVRHGNASRAYRAYRANGEPAAFYTALRVGIPLGAMAYIGILSRTVISANP